MAASRSHLALSRRELLTRGLGVAGALAVGRSALALSAALPEFLALAAPFKIGIQSYSLRGYTKDGKADRAKALAVSHDLGVHFWEAYPAHIPMTDDLDQIRLIKDEMSAAGVETIGFGVIPFRKGDPANRKAFEFAKNLGVSYLSADPEPDSFDDLDKLVDEFDIGVGIHNHGPGHRYDKIDVIAKAIEKHHAKIGCCIDTGHFLRSKEDPVRAAEVFGKRVYGVHLKDVKDAQHFTILGKGDLNTHGLLRVLNANGYKGLVAVEYEENEKNPVDDVRACLEEVEKVLQAGL
ncbi:sugar phosphate isomerase/epimerase family protein [Paludisphaera borealis]|uniref:Inosose dehydratase n=1 Tax=Paludisphaera borealis TaxID=1387353 RepID=A0A1U7CM56_9BACT|nr:sugar phosphate isomerase/epimerase [Paludisphaera borealis]APW59963.1 Inosose dehydratase [Paludisphaera borealis]